MNDTTPPPGTPGASGAPGAPSDPGTQTPHDRPESFSFERTSGRFFSWIRGLGIERSSDRWFAGVAGGIAAKAGIDPLIVRGIFVVLAINVVALFARLRLVATPEFERLFESRELQPSPAFATMFRERRTIILGAFAPLASIIKNANNGIMYRFVFCVVITTSFK